MSDSINLDEIERRAQRAFYEDGLFDIILGGYLMVLALVFVIHPSFIVFLIFIMSGFKSLTELLKERYVYPRMGYAEYPETLGAPNSAVIGLILTSVVGMFALFFILVWFFGTTGWILWFMWISPLTFGCLISTGLLVVAGQMQLKRYYLFGVLPILVGILTPFIFIIPEPGYSSLLNTVGLEMTIVAILTEIAGLWLFARFLRRHPITKVDIDPTGDFQ
ncbi:MAG: hypothetical protein ACXACA_06130 [Candidatus Ranarchaeia archaeon]|jgi:hypothetical protein